MTQPLLRKLRAWQMEVIKSENIMLTVKFIRLLYYVVGAMFPSALENVSYQNVLPYLFMLVELGGLLESSVETNVPRMQQLDILNHQQQPTSVTSGNELNGTRSPCSKEDQELSYVMPTQQGSLTPRPPSRGQQQQSHISYPKLVFGLPRCPELDVSQRCNDNVLPSPPDPMMSCRCYHLDGKHVCVPKVFSTPSNPDKKHFYLDSGACFHMTGNPSILQPYPNNLNITPPIQFVCGANGSLLPVCGCGYINTDGIKLDGVLYVPGLIANLVSVGQLASMYSVRTVFDRNLFSIEKLLTGERIGQGHREGNLYVLDHFLPS